MGKMKCEAAERSGIKNQSGFMTGGPNEHFGFGAAKYAARLNG